VKRSGHSSERLTCGATGFDAEKSDPIERLPGPPRSHRCPGYQKGRFFAGRRTAEGFASAIGYYRQAIAKDPRCAQAWSGLSDAYMLSAWYDDSRTRPAHRQAREAALRAIALDDSLAEAHSSLALVHENPDWAFRDAQKEYRRALELNPNYSTAEHWYGEFPGFMGHTEDGLAHLRRAQQLDPLSLIIGTRASRVGSADAKKRFLCTVHHGLSFRVCGKSSPPLP
jgi:tetratricopeptide (TPR) repeat protein